MKVTVGFSASPYLWAGLSLVIACATVVSFMRLQTTPSSPPNTSEPRKVLAENLRPRNRESTQNARIQKNLIDPGQLSMEDLLALAKRLASENILLGIHLGESISDPERQMAFFDEFFGAWAQFDAEGATEYVSIHWDFDIGIREKLIRTPLIAWAEESPMLTADFFHQLWMENNDPLTGFGHFLHLALQTWAQSTPSKAWEWLSQNSGLHDEAGFMSTIISEWAESDPVSALKNGLNYEEGSPQSISIFNAGLTRWASNNATEASLWLDQNVSSDELGKLIPMLENVGYYIKKQIDGQAALDWASLIPNEKARSDVIKDLAYTWADAAPLEALNGLVQKLDSSDQALPRALESAVFNLSTDKPNVVAEWLNEQPPSEMKDGLIEQFVDYFAQDDPFSAIDWANSIENSAQRETALFSVLLSMVYYHPEAYTDWVKENGKQFPTSFEKRLLEIKSE